MIELRRHLDLDAFDLKILAVLQTSARMSKVKLAELIGLSPTPCGTRIERLEKAGLIRGYHADIDYGRLAMLMRFRVLVSIRDWSPARGKRFEAAIVRTPHIVECEAVLGNVDFMMTILASSIEHYQEIMSALLSQGIEIDYTTYPVSKLVKRDTNVCSLNLLKEETRS